MKLLKTILIALGAVSLGILVSCNKKKTTKIDPTTKVTTKDNSSSRNTTKGNSSTKRTTTEKITTQDIDPEVAMNNFLSKVDSLNYTVKSEDLTTYVINENLIMLDYTSPETSDLAWMCVNGEVFEGRMRSTFDVTFIEYGNAISTATYAFRTLNSIEYASGGNIWDLFTNIGRTGEYISTSEYLKVILCYLAEAPKDFAGTIDEVKLTIYGEAANKATLSGHFGLWNVDLEAEITFDTTGVDKTIPNTWMESPVYPAAKTEWDMYDMGSFVTLFYKDDEDCLPFVDGMTYAYYVNYQVVSQNEVYEARDLHLAQSDYLNYIAKLESNGYTLETERDGIQYYHKSLRPDVGLVASVMVDWDSTNGFYLALRPYYVCEEYDRLSDINSLLTANNLPNLSTKSVKECYAMDVTGPDMDEIIYISEYSLVLEADLTFEDETTAEIYLAAFIEYVLELGYKEHPASMFDPNEYYQTVDETKSVRYMINNNVLSFRFKAAKYYAMIDVDEALDLNGFTSITGKTTDAWLYYTAKDEKKHEHFQNGHDYIYAFSVNLCYEDANKADAFADAYASELVNNLGFEEMNGFFVKDLLTVKIQVLMNEDQTYLVTLKFLKDTDEL